jgi:hypothetical protein
MVGIVGEVAGPVDHFAFLMFLTLDAIVVDGEQGTVTSGEGFILVLLAV